MTNDAPLPPSIPPQPAPVEVYAVFAGVIEQATIQRIFAGLGAAMANKVQRVHLLFQSTGGTVADGVCLYNFLHRLPIEICLYNVGTVATVGALVFLGAKVRNTSASATFMLHRTQASPMGATAERLQAITKSVALDDQRTEAILRHHLVMPDDLWEVHKTADLWLSAEEGVKYGLATKIAEFAPPFGSQVYNI